MNYFETIERVLKLVVRKTACFVAYSGIFWVLTLKT